MNWSKNNWFNIIDTIYIETIKEIEKNKLKGVILITQYLEDRFFYDLLKYKNPALYVNYNHSCYFNDLKNDDDEMKMAAIFYSEKNSGNYLLCSGINRNRFKFIKDFDENDYFNLNFLPFVNLFSSDLKKIIDICCKNEDYKNYNRLSIDKYCFVSKSFNWQREYFSAEELEWADLENEKNSIIISDESPVNNYYWHSYSATQQKIIARIWAIEKETRWKLKTPRLLNLEINR